MVLGTIAEFMVARQVTAQGDIVYIDKGAAEGVGVGDWFYIIRPAKHTAFLTQLPDENVAELRIIGLQDHTATALVTVTSDALRRGDIVVGGPSRLGTQRAKVEELALVPVEPVPVFKPLADILFAFDQYILSEKAKTDLAEVRAALKDNPSAKILILGYADERGSSEYNLTLGKRRATEVQQYLARLGLQNPMTTSSLGEDRPACTEHTEACYTVNRRVQVVLENN
jgi:outer membrane protein OmpA-like peptidoglycan-associated protein